MNKLKRLILGLVLGLGLGLGFSAPVQAQANYNFDVGGLPWASGGAVPGSCPQDGGWFWLNTGAKSWYVCNNGTYGAVGGGTGVGSGAAPAMAFYLSNQCPASNTGNCFNTPADTQVINNCTWNSGNATVTCASGTFASTDVGKTAFGYAGNCNPFQSQPLTGALTTTKTTIQTFTDSAHVVMAATASASAAGTGCLIFGHPDDAGAVSLSTAIASLTTAPQCPKVFLAASGYMFLGLNNETMFWQNPPACSGTPGLGGGGALGNMFYAAGYEIEGRGPGTTILWLPPDFPETGTCTHGNLSTSCYAVPLEGRWSNLQISGGSGAAGTNVPNGNAILNVDVGSLDYVTLTNLVDVTNAQSHTCVQVTHWAQMQQVNVSACGDINMLVSGGANATCYRCSLEAANSVNSGSTNLNIGASPAEFTCYSCNFFGTQTAASALSSVVSNGGTLYLYRAHFAEQVGTNQFYYQALTNAGSKLIMRDSLLNNGGATKITSLFCNVTCTLDLQGNTVVAAGAGSPISISAAGSLVINRGGNSFSGGTASTNSGTTLNLDSQGTAAVVAGNTVLSANWGTSAAIASFQGGNSFTATITNGTAATGAAPTITYTFPTPLPINYVPYCAAIQTGGTNAVGSFTASAASATGVTFTFSLTPTANNTEVIEVLCQ